MLCLLLLLLLLLLPMMTTQAHCTATFRAPELFDVPSHCTLDGRMDVWALGCTL
jgi:serine/threonine kinase 16